ncbi:tyrosine-protein phosphatase non-receptor type 9-like [Actinia tenebrosa]|uniref:Tyrosine-protein phosphatase non-receptor type 9-like n=1 Tax=Actinia tenebrosa TaxID=6105 RepID=A0A6P8HFK8_ACTTE|nr:tyrosine-protein phosphatase non-receptor type 9-like [Actinia tenebrosa]
MAEDRTGFTETEKEAITIFLTQINNDRTKHGLSPIGTSTAIKFLIARKFDPERAIELYRNHQDKCVMYGLNEMSPYDDPMRQELLSGKFTVLEKPDPEGAAIAMINASLHFPELTTHDTVIKGMVFQLDEATKDVVTQRNGLILLYDMSNSSYKNFDYELSHKVLDLLKGCYPARLKRVFIISPPLWFKAILLILSSLLREKIRERIEIVSSEQLQEKLPLENIPKTLGGTLPVDHFSWLNKCLASYAETLGVNDIPDSPKTTENGWESTTEGRGWDSRQPQCEPGVEETMNEVADFGEPVMSVSEFMQHVRELGKRGIKAQYMELKSLPLEGVFDKTRLRVNVRKNRYTDVLCLEGTRVPLTPIDEDDFSDYIHANYVDGYKQPKAFIATQGPLPNTTGDFWRMVWEQKSVVVVMITRCFERNRIKCKRYWPENGDTDAYMNLRIQHIETQEYEDHVERIFDISDTETQTSRTIMHFQMTSWPDFGVPSSAESCLHILGLVRQAQASAVLALWSSWTGHPSGPPMVVHCSAGVGRTGTFCTIDINIERMKKQGTCEISNTVKYLRNQRAHMIQTPDQYEFCHLAVLEFALSLPMLSDSEKEEIARFLNEWRSAEDSSSESD